MSTNTDTNLKSNNKSMCLNKMEWKAGSHVPFAGRVYESLLYGIQEGMYSIQIFLGNPKSYTRQKISDDDIFLSAGEIYRYPMNLFIHTPYLFNLAGSASQLAWRGDRKVNGITTQVVKSLEYELFILNSISKKSKIQGCKYGVIVHPGTNKNKQEGLKVIAETVNKIYNNGPAKLLLENASGGGTKLCTMFKEIRTIIDLVEPEKRKYVGVCIDTAHIFGFGSYDLRSCDEVDRMFKEFDDIIGAEYLSLLHLNDSQMSEKKSHNAYFGSEKDRHQLLGDGYIWSDGFDSLVHLLNICKDRDIPIILETDPSDMCTLIALDKVSTNLNVIK